MAEYNFLNDITKFGNNALSAANTLQRQVRAWVTEQVEYLIKSMELITQDELNAYSEAQNKKIADLENRIAELEKASGVSVKAAPVAKAAAKTAKTATPKKPAAKKVAAKKKVK